MKKNEQKEKQYAAHVLATYLANECYQRDKQSGKSADRSYDGTIKQHTLASVLWEHETLDALEQVRTELRELVKLLEGGKKQKFIIDAAFIRVINGIDRQRALHIYKQFVDGYDLTSEQERYLKNILDYVSTDGDIETKNFLEYPLKSMN